MNSNENSVIAITDDDDAVRDSLAQMLRLQGYKTALFSDGAQLLEYQGKEGVSCFILDVMMPKISGADTLKSLIKENAPGPIIVITGHGDVNMAVKMMQMGAYDFIEKPFNKEHLISSIKRAVDKYNLLYETKRLREELKLARTLSEDNFGILGESDGAKKVRDEIRAYADTDTTALITGETGSGKELVAQGLHKQSSRGKNRFVALNMASLPETLAMSELFGYAKGAFTGASSLREGKLQYAAGGSILLDEINSCSLSIQAGILRAIENKVIERIGENRSIPIDVRIMATANTDLLELVEQNKFREDLYHRLKMVSIHVPPLRERSEDIPLLAKYFVEDASAKYGREPVIISQDVIRQMEGYHWPGNIRELKHTIVSLVIGCPGDTITKWEMSGANKDEQTTYALKPKVEEYERSLVSDALEKADGNLKFAADILEIPQRTLYDKMRKHRLTKDNFK